MSTDNEKLRTDIQVLQLSLRRMTLALDELITEVEGYKSPYFKKAIAKARGYLPPYCVNAYSTLRKESPIMDGGT